MLRIMMLLSFQLCFCLVAWSQATGSNTSSEPCSDESNLHPTHQLGTLASTAQNAACVQTYQQKRCEEFKQSLDPEDQSKVITCTDEDSLSVGKVLLSCGAGVKDFVVDAATGMVYLVSQLPQLPGAIINELNRTGEFLKKCNEDASFRASLFESVAPLYSETEQSALLQDLSCEGLMLTVRNQSRNGLDDITKKKQLQTRFQERYPDREMPANIRLTPGEEEFQRRYFAAADVASEANRGKLNAAFSKIWNQVQTELACYNTAAKIQITCAILAEGAVTVASGGAVAALSRSTKVRQAMSKIRGSLNAEERALIRGSNSAEAPRAPEARAPINEGSNPDRSAARVGMTRQERAETVAATSRMTRSERIAETEKIFGRQLSSKERDSVWKAHLMGAENLKNNGRYSSRDLLEKRRELAKAGFSAEEINQLMRRGITGEAASGYAGSALGQSTVKDVLARAGVQQNVIDRFGHASTGRNMGALSSSESQRVVDTLTGQASLAARSGNLQEARSIYQTAYDINVNVAQTAVREGREGVAEAYFSRSFAFKGAWDPATRSSVGAYDEIVGAATQAGYFNKIPDRGFDRLYNPSVKENMNVYEPRSIALHGKTPEEVYLSNNRQLQELLTLVTLKDEARKASYGSSRVFQGGASQVPSYLNDIPHAQLTQYIQTYKRNLQYIEENYFKKP